MKLDRGEALTVLFDTGNAPVLRAGRVAMPRGRAELEWSADIIRRGLALSPLHYPPESGLHPAQSRAFEGLHGFLADSLPEGWGALLMRRRLAQLGHDMNDLSAVDRLALVGREGRGALVFEPATTPEERTGTIDLDAIARESRLILLGEESSLAAELAKLGGASGGARPKIHVGFDISGKSCVADGETAEGYAAWIVKFPATTDPVDIGPIEQAYAIMARAAGIAMSETRLIATDAGPGYFATRRFDRSDRRRIHMASLAGAIEAPPNVPGAINYDMFLRATRTITRHVGDIEQAFRRMTFNVLAGNRDDHTRQHAYLMDEAGEWRLAPAYDLTWSTGPGGEHYLDVAGEGRNPTRAHVEKVGTAHSIAAARIDEIVEQVSGAVDRWDEIAREQGVGAASRKEIAVGLTRISARFRA
jgi:serine/threonine-protein kinase HipA